MGETSQFYPIDTIIRDRVYKITVDGIFYVVKILAIDDINDALESIKTNNIMANNKSIPSLLMYKIFIYDFLLYFSKL